MDSREIHLRMHGILVKASLLYSVEPPKIILHVNGSEYSCRADDLFSCFIKLRLMLPHVEFLCKGAKINVYPSRASSQMSAGLMAYELAFGKQATRNNLINIFDYDTHGLTNDPLAQGEFFERWIESLNLRSE